jgi:hypothetical protein
MASTAIFIVSIESNFSTLDDLFPLVIAAVSAQAVGQLGFSAFGANGQAFHFQGVMGSSFIFSGMGMSSFGLGHFSPLYFFKQEFYFIFCLFARAGAVIQVGAAAGADPLAVAFADGLEGNEQIDLFDQYFFQIDLVVFVKDIFQFLFIQDGAALLYHFTGEKDDIETGIDFQFKLLQAAYANQGNGRLDLALGLDALVLVLEKYLVVDPFEKKAFVLEQLGAVDVNGVVQRVALIGDFIDVYYHF